MSYGSHRYGLSGMGGFSGLGSGLSSGYSGGSSGLYSNPYTSSTYSPSGAYSSGLGSGYASSGLGSGYSSSGLGSTYGSGSHNSSGHTSGGYGSGIGSSGLLSSTGPYGSRSSSTSSLPTSTYYAGLSSLGSTSSRLGRYGATDVPATTDSSSVRARPQSYTELTRSTGALDTDYKKLYEEEKDENTRLRKELDQCKKELIEAKTELDRLMRRNDTSRNTTTNDQREKRALERKVSEYEEELKKMEALKADNQRLKDENGALIRVISKLSK